MSTYTSADRWDDAIDAFEAAMLGQKLAPATIDLRLKHARKFANCIGLSPYRVTYEDYRVWLERLDCGRHGMLGYRTSLRSFYRWAQRSGRMLDDPTEEPSSLAQRLPVPPSWEAPLQEFRAYLRSIGRPPTTVRTRMAQLRRFARDNARLRPYEATFEDLVEWLAEKRWSPETRRAARSALRTFYAWAKDTGRMRKNPARKLPVIRRGTHAPRPTLDHELHAALAAADPLERMAIRLAVELGLRRSEVVLVHSRDLLQIGGDWHLRVHGKGNRERMLPLTAGMLGALRSFGDGWVFPGGIDGHMSPHYMGLRVSALLPAGVTMHSLRHRFATKAYNVDHDVFSVQMLLGHASPATTRQYVKVDDSRLRTLVEAVSA
jgi:site-specific recombinase XerD